MSASNIYCNSFKNRTLTSDTVFYGANSAGDNRIEYMKWNRTDQSLDFNAPIDNTNIAVIGNIVDTQLYQMKDLKLIFKMLKVIIAIVSKMLK